MSQYPPDRPVTERRGYFARFFGFARGAGGELSSVRSRSSARRSTSSRGSRSSDSDSRFGVRRFGLGGGFGMVRV